MKSLPLIWIIFFSFCLKAKKSGFDISSPSGLQVGSFSFALSGNSTSTGTTSGSTTPPTISYSGNSYTYLTGIQITNLTPTTTGTITNCSTNLAIKVRDNSATSVYGQGTSFTTNSANNGGTTGAATLSNNSRLAVDSSGNLYVADAGNHRVLYFPSGSTTAVRVFGQFGNLNSYSANNGGVSANSLNFPVCVAVDSTGVLYISDSSNNRILVY